MPSLAALERRIEADRVALNANYRRLHTAVSGRIGSPAGLATGFAVGFAGGWFTVSRAKRRREREDLCPKPAPAENGRARPKPGKLERLRTLVVLTLPLWQRLMTRPATPPEAGDASPT